MNCPVCEKKLAAMVCDCGYDRSRDYEKYPTFGPVPKGVESIAAAKTSRVICKEHKDKPDESALTREQIKEEKSEPRKKVIPSSNLQDHLHEQSKGEPKRIVEISVGKKVTAVRYADHTVRAEGSAFLAGKRTWAYVEEWKDIVQIAAMDTIIVGLKKDGTLALGKFGEKVQNAKGWSNIKQIAAGAQHLVALKHDGTVLAAEFLDVSGECNVMHWRDIVAISANGYLTVGLRKDGTVVAAGDNSYGQCEVSHWKNIVAIVAGIHHVVGIRADGTVVTSGADILDGRWEGTGIAASEHIVSIKPDGTVASLICYNNAPECKLDDWCDIISLAVAEDRTVGLKKDGTLIAAGKDPKFHREIERLMRK